LTKVWLPSTRAS